MSTTVNIDGFTVGTTAGFQYTSDYLKKRYDAFNERYFNGTLPDIEVKKVTSKKNVLGTTHTTGMFQADTREVVRISKQWITINSFYERSERTICSTLIHEMIHVWESAVEGFAPGHEARFKSKMNEINSKTDWDVTTTESASEAEERGSAPKSLLDNISNNMLLGAIYSQASYVVFLFNRKDADKFKWAFNSYLGSKVFQINDATMFSQFRVCRTKIEGKRWTLNKVAELIEKGTLSEVSLNEATADAVEEGIRKKINAIESNCLLAIRPTGYSVKRKDGYGFLIRKKLFNDMKEYFEYDDFEVFKIYSGETFLKWHLCGTYSAVEKFDNSRYIDEGEIDSMKSDGIIGSRNLMYESNETSRQRLKEAKDIAEEFEKDPYTTVDILNVRGNIVNMDITIS